MGSNKGYRIPIDLEKVEQAARICSSEEDIALALGVSYCTLRRRKQENEQFAQAIKRGRAKANLFVGSKLMEKIASGDTASIIFYLKARCGWKETQRIEGEMTTTEKPPEGLQDIYNALARGKK